MWCFCCHLWSAHYQNILWYGGLSIHLLHPFGYWPELWLLPSNIDSVFIFRCDIICEWCVSAETGYQWLNTEWDGSGFWLCWCHQPPRRTCRLQFAQLRLFQDITTNCKLGKIIRWIPFTNYEQHRPHDPNYERHDAVRWKPFIKHYNITYKQYRPIGPKCKLINETLSK